MPFSAFSPRLSLKARLILNYLVILGAGGLATSLVGSWIVSSTIMMQARRSVNHDLAAARTLYDHELETLRLTVRFAASGTGIQRGLSGGERAALFAPLDSLRKDAGFDFLGVTDRNGRVLVRSTQRHSAGDDVSWIGVVGAALSGRAAAATEILSAEALAKEDPALRDRAYLRFVPTPKARPISKQEETSGMVLIAAAPVLGEDGSVLGSLFGGVLLNRNFKIVDRTWELMFRGEQFEGRDVGTVTIFQNDVRISTNVTTASGERAVGTLVSDEVYQAVCQRGESWRDRAFVVSDWYISGYEPIRNYRGDVVGILYVGVLEQAFTSTRDRVILSFFGIATLGFILIIAITYYEISRITRPVGEMVAATRHIAAGRFNHEVQPSSTGEIALLAESFNTMLHSLRQMKADLEEWARTLEQKVKERTDELVAMQAQVVQSQRLASLGQLSAGVAHEINNPLGAVMALTWLCLEDLKKDDPNRENLEEVLRQAERCRDIVKGLLDFSRQSTVNTEPVEVNRVLNDTLSLLGRQAMFFNIEVVRDLDPDLPPVMADRSQLQQVFVNILVNAAHAMNEKGTVTVVTRAAGTHFLEIQISDTGCGIPTGKIDQIFDPFFTTKDADQGTGLGLSIAYGIVASHGGTISVASEAGHGSTFTVRLPLASPVPLD